MFRISGVSVFEGARVTQQLSPLITRTTGSCAHILLRFLVLTCHSSFQQGQRHSTVTQLPLPKPDGVAQLERGLSYLLRQRDCYERPCCCLG